MRKLILATVPFGAVNANAANLLIEMEQMPKRKRHDERNERDKNKTRGVCKIYDDGKPLLSLERI